MYLKRECYLKKGTLSMEIEYYQVILLLTNSTYEINTIQETFPNNSVLNFTQEININNKIPFLGVLIDTNNID